MKILITRLTVWSLSVALLAGCQALPPISVDFDTSYDYSQLKTYYWLSVEQSNEGVAIKGDSSSAIETLSEGAKESVSESKEPAPANKNPIQTLDSRRQMSSIEKVLTEKGFKKVDETDKADFGLKIRQVTDKKVTVNQHYGPLEYSLHHYPFSFRHFDSSVSREYEIGTLILDIIDTNLKQVIWTGAITQKSGIYRHSAPAERTAKSLENIQLLLSSFPPTKVD